MLQTLAVKSWTWPIEDPVLVFAVLMMVILIAPLVAQRLRGPGIVGLIIAGILIGPNAMNILDRSETVVLLGTAGLLYIMFIAGIEIDLYRFKKYRSHSLIFGSATFLIPQVLGTLMAIVFLDFGWAAAILLASMFASHTLVPYPIMSRLGLAKCRSVTTTVGGTIITDTAALLVLAIVAASTRGELNAAFWLTLMVSLTIYTSVVWWGLPWLGRWFFNTIPSDGIAHFVFVIASVYLCAYFAEVAGVEAIIGAFLAGLALNRLVPDQSVMMARLEFAGNWFFIPVFLISVGMLVDPRALYTDLAAWKISLAMVTTVIVTKFLAAVVSSRILGYDKVESRIMFGLSVNQAAATLAAVMIGVQLGIFGDAVLNGAIMMILATCLIGPWVTQRYGRLLAQKEQEGELEDGFEQRPRILIPLRNPKGAEAILDVAFMIRPKDTDEPIFPLTVVQDADDASRQLITTERMLGNAVIHALAANIPVTPTIRLDTNPADGIVRAARELRVSTIVMGWTGISPARSRVFGSVLDQLLERCTQQFVVCHLVTELSTAERMVIVVPPFAHREFGFKQAVYSLKMMAQRAGLTVAISAAESDIKDVHQRIASIAPDVAMVDVPVSSIDQWQNPRGDMLRKTDILVLLSARREQLSWQAALDHIPQQIAMMQPPVSMLVVYPGMGDEERSITIVESQYEELFNERRIVLQMASTSIDAIIRELISTEFGDEPQLEDELSGELIVTARTQPIEVTPGSVLLHIHSSRIDEPLAFIATLEQGIQLDKASRETRMVIVLLTPTALSASKHLQHVAFIARILQEESNTDAILTATDSKQVMNLIQPK